MVTGATARALWRIREDGAGLGGRTPANEPAWPGWEDSAVPPEQLGDYLRELSELMRSHHLDALLYGHFGDGCVHGRIDFPFRTSPLVFRQFMTDAATLVAKFGGSMSGEHGDGRARSELLPFMYSPEAISLFGAVKAIFDQDNLLNPGVIADPVPIDDALRVPAARPMIARLGFALRARRGRLHDRRAPVHRGRQVPGRHHRRRRGHVPVLSGDAGREGLDPRPRAGAAGTRQRHRSSTASARARSPSPSTYAWPARAARVTARPASTWRPTRPRRSTSAIAARLRPLAHYSLGRLPRRAALAARAPRLVNACWDYRAWPRRSSGSVESTTAGHCPSSRHARSSSGSPAGATVVGDGVGPGVLLWVDTFTNHFSPEVGRAAVQVLESAGYAVRVVDGPACCGLTWISTGQLDGARRQLRRTLTALESAIADGIPIVGLEPSCTAVLRSDLTELLPDDARAARVQAATVTLAELLARTPGWQSPSLADVQGVAQPHCHHHAVLGWDADAALLAGAGAQITAVGGCCGLAGNFGVERGHYDVSVAVAETALLPASVRWTGRGRAGRRLLVPHPARPAGRTGGRAIWPR